MGSDAPGTVTVEGLSLGPGTNCRAFIQAVSAKGLGGTTLANGQTRWTMAGARVEPGPDRWHVTATFEWERLSRLELFALQRGDGNSWADWTHDNEMKRKAHHEAWARLAFGKPMEPLALDPGDGGSPVMPFEIGPEHPRSAAYAWGEAASFFDSNGGQSFLRISYARPEVTPSLPGIAFA